MARIRRTCSRHVLLLLLALAAMTPWLWAQPAKSAPAAAAQVSGAVSEENIAATREQLIRLLRISPRLTQVVGRDQSLLADPQYVARNNPDLAAFLQQHPEVARNPEFYLFGDTGRGERFYETVWPEQSRGGFDRDVAGGAVAFLVFLVIMGALLWLIRVLLDTRRWNRTFKVQTDIYNKFLDKFSSNEDLLAYVRSEAGKRFLESASLPLTAEPRGGNLLGRVLRPLQFGVVVLLLGFGFLYLRNDFRTASPFLVFGVLAVMLGLGFMISSALSWVLARQLGLMPPHDESATDAKALETGRGL